MGELLKKIAEEKISEQKEKLKEIFESKEAQPLKSGESIEEKPFFEIKKIQNNNLSFLTIYRSEDFGYSEGYLAHIPEGTEVVLVQCMRDKARKGLFDTIVTELDGGRTLKTAVYYFQNSNHWLDSFSDALNEAKKLCTRGWIVKLDIDERVNFEPSEIEALESGILPPTVGGIHIPLHNYTRPTGNNKFATCSTAQLIRLFRNLPEFTYRHRVHEQIAESILEQGYNIVVIPEVSPQIRHLGYKGDDNKKIADKFLRNVFLMCREITETDEKQVGTLNWLFQYLLKSLETMEQGGMIKRIDDYGG